MEILPHAHDELITHVHERFLVKPYSRVEYIEAREIIRKTRHELLKGRYDVKIKNQILIGINFNY